MGVKTEHDNPFSCLFGPAMLSTRTTYLLHTEPIFTRSTHIFMLASCLPAPSPSGYDPHHLLSFLEILFSWSLLGSCLFLEFIKNTFLISVFAFMLPFDPLPFDPLVIGRSDICTLCARTGQPSSVRYSIYCLSALYDRVFPSSHPDSVMVTPSICLGCYIQTLPLLLPWPASY